MNDVLELKGLWHLPENPHQKVAGILKFDPQGKILLELIGSFEEVEENPSIALAGVDRFVPIIYGETSDGKYITLFNCSKSGSYNFSCSFPLTNFSVNFILQGYFLKDFDTELFDYIEFGIPILSKWIGRNTHNFTMQFDGIDSVAKLQMGKKYSLTFKYDIDQNTQIELCTGSYYNYSGSDLIIRQDGYCRIYSYLPLNIESFINKINIFKSLVSIGYLENLYFSDIKLYNKALSAEISGNDESEIGFPLLYIQHQFDNKTPSNKKLFYFDVIENNFAQIIKKWYKNTVDLQPIRNHLLNAIVIRGPFSSTDFLILAFAIEGFYCRFRNGYKNTNLRNAVEELLVEFNGIKQIKVLNLDKGQVNDSRNYYSHLFNTADKPKTLFGKDLYILAQKLKLLLICCVLKEIGFSDNMIETCISDS